MKNKLVKSTIILVIGGIITKLLSFIIRVYFTRVIKDGIEIYSLVMPTYSLLITITQFGFPIAISNLVAKGVKRGKKIVLSVIPVSIFLNIFLIFIMLIFSKYLSTSLLHNSSTYYPLIAMSFVMPFISLSSIIRGYFFGKQQMMPHSISNVIEQLFKLCIVLLVLPHLVKYSKEIAVSGYILISILSETISIIIFLLFLPKGWHISKEDIKPDYATIKDVLTIGIPSVGSRIVGNIGYFFEPIILTNLLLINGYPASFISNEYAVYNTYVIGILIIPTFLLGAISTSLLPEISKNYEDKFKIRKIFKRTLTLSLLLGVISNIFIFFMGKYILQIVFNTIQGLNYIKFLCPFFILYYFEAPLSSVLQGYGETKYILKTTTIGIIIKLLIMSILCFFKIGIYSLILSEIIYILIVVYFNMRKVISLIK